MPRIARMKSESGIYHIMVRGINRQNIFTDTADRYKFLDLVKQYKPKCGYSIFAYCLMDNHVHLVLKEGEEPLEGFMKRIGVSYVSWYNGKYNRIGHLFQDRYKSEVIEDDKYLLEVIRYVHQNPVKAGITTDPGSYPWSSYLEYLGSADITDTAFILGMLSLNDNKAQKLFMDYMGENGRNDTDLAEKVRLTDEAAREMIEHLLGDFSTEELANMDKEQRNALLGKLKGGAGLSIRQIARITGLTFNIVAKA